MLDTRPPRLHTRSDAWKAQVRRQLRNTSAPVYYHAPSLDYSFVVTVIVCAIILLAFVCFFQFAG
jgi:hypothetical protein